MWKDVGGLTTFPSDKGHTFALEPGVPGFCLDLTVSSWTVSSPLTGHTEGSTFPGQPFLEAEEPVGTVGRLWVG